MIYTDAEIRLWEELRDFAQKASGDRKTQVAACLLLAGGRKVFGANRLQDGHDLTEQEIADRIKPKFYDAMKCGEPDAIDKAVELGLDLSEARLYTLLFPCPRCAVKIAKTKLRTIVALTHRTKHNGKFDNPLEDSQKTFDNVGIQYDIGEPDRK
jgi:tRNA(Arg) A34 adenosine deaminase TadA